MGYNKYVSTWQAMQSDPRYTWRVANRSQYRVPWTFIQFAQNIHRARHGRGQDIVKAVRMVTTLALCLISYLTDLQSTTITVCLVFSSAMCFIEAMELLLGGLYLIGICASVVGITVSVLCCSWVHLLVFALEFANSWIGSAVTEGSIRVARWALENGNRPRPPP